MLNTGNQQRAVHNINMTGAQLQAQMASSPIGIKSSEIEGLLGTLHARQTALAETVSILLDRISPVLRPVGPAGDENSARPAASTSLGSRLDEMVSGVQTIEAAVQSALQRLEL